MRVIKALFRSPSFAGPGEMVGRQHSCGAAALRLERIKPVPSADIENGFCSDASPEDDVGHPAQSERGIGAPGDVAIAKVDRMKPAGGRLNRFERPQGA